MIDRVHAKYFRCDQVVLIGSANLTGAALGWAENINLELVQEAEWGKTAREFERQLHALSTPATEEIAETVEGLARELPQPVVGEAYGVKESAEWWPSLREPKDLWLAYSGGRNRMTRLSSDASRADLLALEIPPGLDMAQFRALVGIRLLQHRNVATIDEFLETPRRFGEVRDQISQMSGMSRSEASQRWQALMRWFLEYCPGRFEVIVPRHSEVMRKVKG